jgi:C4-type Zn-finger protein
VKLKIFPEECCEECGEIIHNHMDCPSCKNEYAGTDAYGDVLYYQEVGFVLKCEECGAKFRLVSKGEEAWDKDGWDWEKVQ